MPLNRTDVQWEPKWPFGPGLVPVTYEYDDPAISHNDDPEGQREGLAQDVGVRPRRSTGETDDSLPFNGLPEYDSLPQVSSLTADPFEVLGGSAGGVLEAGILGLRLRRDTSCQHLDRVGSAPVPRPYSPQAPDRNRRSRIKDL